MHCYKTFNDLWNERHDSKVYLVCVTDMDAFYLVTCVMKPCDESFNLQIDKNGCIIKTYVNKDATHTDLFHVESGDNLMVVSDPQVLFDIISVMMHKRLRVANAQIGDSAAKRKIFEWRNKMFEQLSNLLSVII